MQIPVFGQNPALAAAQSKPAPATLAAAKPEISALPAEEAPVLPTSVPKTPVAPTDPAARAPMGFLEMARQIQNRAENEVPASAGHGPGLFGEDGFDFYDVLDVINPLQHIPIVSTIYRAISGDTIAAGPRMAGGALFGGVFGLMSAAVNAAIEEQTGHDIGDHVRLALLGGPDDNAEQEPVMFASADTKTTAADTAETVTASLGVPATTHKLTPEQVAILNQYDGAAETAADVMPAAGPAPASSDVPELSPEQEELLLRSLGLSPPETKTSADAAPAPELTGDAKPVTNESETPAVPEAAAAPQPPANVEPLPRAPAGANAAFAQRMKNGLERYFAQPTPLNPVPPQIDERW